MIVDDREEPKKFEGEIVELTTVDEPVPTEEQGPEIEPEDPGCISGPIRDYEAEIKQLKIVLEREVGFSSEVLEENQSLKKQLEAEITALEKEIEELEKTNELLRKQSGKMTVVLNEKDKELHSLKISAIADNIALGEVKAISNYWKSAVKNLVTGK